MGLDLEDIQGHVLRGYRADRARHFALAVGDAAGGTSFLGELVSGGDPHVSTAEEWDDKPRYCLNVGLTWEGLKALGVPDPVLQAFPPAFRAGPAQRAREVDPDFPNGVGLGDVDGSAPENWILGGDRTPPIHLLVSLWGRSERRLEEQSATLRELFGRHGITEVSHHDANALPEGRVHFGYRDGIAQPRIKGAPWRQFPDLQPEAEPGDFLLGRDHVNAFGGNFIGDLPPALADNGTYAAFRILRQDVREFEELLERWGRSAGMDPELVAAKLMGRWRSGVPLTLSPDTGEPDREIGWADLNEFDFAPAPGHPTYYDDADGLRCPIGSHIRRLNPRGALVMGKPHSRRIIRRGMPYGPPFDPSQPDDGAERGLLGTFICGDLELQYEFTQRAWANQDLATHGIRGTRDPITGAQPPGRGSFTIRTADTRDPVLLGGLPTLVDTRGSLYCFMPGIGGLRHLASAS